MRTKHEDNETFMSRWLGSAFRWSRLRWSFAKWNTGSWHSIHRYSMA